MERAHGLPKQAGPLPPVPSLLTKTYVTTAATTPIALDQHVFTGLGSLPVFAPSPIFPMGEDGLGNDRLEHNAHELANQLDAGDGPSLQGNIESANGGHAGLRNVPAPIHASIQSSRGGGSQLPSSISESVSMRLGSDLRGVRVHTDDQAHKLNQQLHTRAFTTGNHIFFRQGEYSPSSKSGRSVLHHELAHVAQQSGGHPADSLSTSAVAPIQPLIMRIWEDREDDYVDSMVKTLSNKHESEALLRLPSRWDTKVNYAPTKMKRKWYQASASEQRTYPLKGLSSTETVRIVTHGSGSDGRIGGYTAQQMASMLIDIGLPKNHTGGIEIHACLPASYLSNSETGKSNDPFIVQLEDALRDEEINTTVSGYEHCIFPEDSGPMEIAKAGYKLWEQVARDVYQSRVPVYQLADGQIELLREHMGKETDAFLKEHTKYGDGKTLEYRMRFFYALCAWMEKKGLRANAQLRRAASVRTMSPDREP